MAVVVFSDGAQVISGLDGGGVSPGRTLVESLDSSPLLFGGSTLMAPGLLRAFEELHEHARPNVVRRVYCLTDGELHDLEDCRKVLRSDLVRDSEVHVYGFGKSFDVNQLLSLVAPLRTRVVKPLIDTREVVWTFQNLATTAQNVVADRVKLKLTFADGVVLGDMFRYRPIESYDGTIHGPTTTIEISSIERGRSYSYLFELRLQPTQAHELGSGEVVTVEIGTPSDRYNAQAIARVDRRPEPGPIDGYVCVVRDVLLGLRDTSRSAQIARLEARLFLSRAESRDPALIQALERRIQSLKDPENAPRPTDPSFAMDDKYILASPSTASPAAGSPVTGRPAVEPPQRDALVGGLRFQREVISEDGLETVVIRYHGFGRAIVQVSPPAIRMAYLKDIYVEPAKRGRSFGTTLLRAAEGEARMRGATRIGCHPRAYRLEKNGEKTFAGMHDEQELLLAWYKSNDWCEDAREDHRHLFGNWGDWARYL